MIKRLLPLLSLLLLLGAGPLQAAGYQANGGPERHREQGARGETTLDEAVNQVREETGGRILSANTLTIDGLKVHRIKVLGSDQRVRVITIEAGR